MIEIKIAWNCTERERESGREGGRGGEINHLESSANLVLFQLAMVTLEINYPQ